MDGVTVRAYAKINLSLDITGARGGYHLIDSVVASVDIFDEVCVRPRSDGRVSVRMSGQGAESIPEDKNNAYLAARAFAGRFGAGGADIRVVKRIPVGAGLGGSSADAAGALNALALAYGVDDYAALKDIADGVGSDCGYMLRGGYARITGRGERVAPMRGGAELHLLIALPVEGVSTAKCYALSDVYPERRRTSAAVERAICAGQLAELGASLSNGLYPAAAVINPGVRHAAEDLRALGPLGVNMTGSGSAVYALFAGADARDRAFGNYRGECRLIKARTIVPERYV